MAEFALGQQAKDLREGILVARYAAEADGYGGEDSNVTPRDKFFAGRFCSQAVLCSGASGSYAFVPVPMKNFKAGAYDEQMMQVALKRKGPLGESVKLRTRAAVSFIQNNITHDLMTGWLIEHTHSLTDDTGITQIWDDRFILNQFTVNGVLVYDPQAKSWYWDIGRECVYNALGYPDCIDSPLGPCHAPCHRAGYRDGFNAEGIATADYAEPGAGAAIARARTWTVKDVIANLRLRYVAKQFEHKTYIGQRALPAYIDWPEGFAKSINGGQRPLKSFRLEDMALGMALQAVMRKGGPNDLYFKPLPDYRSQLTVLDMGRNAPQVTLSMPDANSSELANSLNSASIINEGYISKSIKNYFDEFVGIGDPPVIEVMISMVSDDAAVLLGLEPAWTTQDDQDARAFIKTNGNDRGALTMAFKRYPLWLCAYRVRMGCNPWKGTKYDGLKNGGRMRFMPFNATGYQQDNKNPRDWQPREIVVEYRLDYDTEVVPAHGADPHDPATEWFEFGRFDGLTLSPDSTIVMLPASRESLTTYYIKSGDGIDPTRLDQNIHYRPIRMNVTLQADWPIGGKYGSIKNGLGTGDPNQTADEVSQVGVKTSYVTRAENGDYIEFLRSQYAHPEGRAKVRYENPPGTTKYIVPREYARRDQEGSELFSDLREVLPTHAALRQPDVRRVENNGLLRVPQIAPVYQPGLCVQIKTKDGIKCIGVLKSATFSSIGHSMRNPLDHAADSWLELGPADWSTLQMIPAAARRAFVGGTAIPTPAVPNKPTSSTGTPTAGTTGYVPPPPAPVKPPVTPETSGYKPSTPQKPAEPESGWQPPAGYTGNPKESAPSSAAGGSAEMRDGPRAEAAPSRRYTGEPRPVDGSKYAPSEQRDAERAQKILDDAQARKAAKAAPKAAETPNERGSGVKKPGESYEEFQKRHPVGGVGGSALDKSLGGAQ